jgi:hypothetical protein
MSKTKRKNNNKTFSAVTAVKSNARDRVGTPKASFTITPKSEKPSRFKTRRFNIPITPDFTSEDEYENDDND